MAWSIKLFEMIYKQFLYIFVIYLFFCLSRRRKSSPCSAPSLHPRGGWSPREGGGSDPNGGGGSNNRGGANDRGGSSSWGGFRGGTASGVPRVGPLPPEQDHESHSGLGTRWVSQWSLTSLMSLTVDWEHGEGETVYAHFVGKLLIKLS